MCVGTTHTLRISKLSRKKRESGQLKIGREKAQFFLNEKVENLSVNFLKPSLSIYSIPLGLGLNYLALK